MKRLERAPGGPITNLTLRKTMHTSSASATSRRPARVFRAGLLVLLSATLSAQTRPDSGVADATMKLQRFVVTGSNIKRLDLEKIAPVTVIDQAAMEASTRPITISCCTRPGPTSSATATLPVSTRSWWFRSCQQRVRCPWLTCLNSTLPCGMSATAISGTRPSPSSA